MLPPVRRSISLRPARQQQLYLICRDPANPEFHLSLPNNTGKRFCSLNPLRLREDGFFLMQGDGTVIITNTFGLRVNAP